jgi:tetratricopeptide (TPR) repeat protein
MPHHSSIGPIALALAALAFGVMPATSRAEEPAHGTSPAVQATPVVPLHAEPVMSGHGGDEFESAEAKPLADEGSHGVTEDLSTDQFSDDMYGEVLNETALTDADPWTRWLLAYEHAVAAREAAKHPESNLLFPLDTSAGAEAHAQPYRHLAIAKAVGELENGGGQRDSGHGNSGHGDDRDGHGGDGSPLLALANARNYLNLSEYDQALEWYRQAAARDGDGHFRRETGRETLMAAICARDTAAAGLAVAATLAAPDYAGRESEVVLAFRWLLNRQDAATLNWLLERTATPQTMQDARVAFWRAYAFSWLERRDESLTELQGLLALGGSGRNLNERERGWVLTATADLLLLAGSRDEAMARYTRLAESPVASLRLWGRLQSASLAFLSHRYGEAGAGFREICQSDSQGTWGAHACAMADIAGQLDKLLSEGERYGADAHYRQ